MSNKSGLELTKRMKKLEMKYAPLRKKLKEMEKDQSIPLEERLMITMQLNKLPRRSSPVRSVNRCSVTGRTGVFRITKMCPYLTRIAIISGELPGFVKASW